jgi:hypothetical protein
MNASLYDIDRAAYLRIVAVGLTAAMMAVAIVANLVAIAANAPSERPLRATEQSAPAVRVAPPAPQPSAPPRRRGVVMIALATASH